MNRLSSTDIFKLLEEQKRQNINTHLIYLCNRKDIGTDLEEFPLVYDTKVYKFIVYINEYQPKLGSSIAIIESSHYNKQCLSFAPQYILDHYLMGNDNINKYYYQFQQKLGDSDGRETIFALGNMVTPNLDYTMWIREEDLQLTRIFVGQVSLTVSQMRQLINQSPYRLHQLKGFNDVTTPVQFQELINMKDAAQLFDFIPFLRSPHILEKAMVYITQKIIYCEN
ncbi:hypothetical protein TCON_2119 [Astathelohania contejeani]|uniref:Uncharacterized protein n=1 Tax=Astathelohania contejeani TaxID=164912 RepID=A0ABQ7HWW7_9MICR|nr:hypothetical protein TCON_2119 [Thelohania contejeani]